MRGGVDMYNDHKSGKDWSLFYFYYRSGTDIERGEKECLLILTVRRVCKYFLLLL